MIESNRSDEGFRTIDMSHFMTSRLPAGSPLLPNTQNEISLDSINALLKGRKFIQTPDGNLDIEVLAPTSSIEDTKEDIAILSKFCQERGILIGPIGTMDAKAQLSFLQKQLCVTTNMTVKQARKILKTKGNLTNEQMRLMNDDSLVYHANQIR